jgi:hypothetical protein
MNYLLWDFVSVEVDPLLISQRHAKTAKNVAGAAAEFHPGIFL